MSSPDSLVDSEASDRFSGSQKESQAQDVPAGNPLSGYVKRPNDADIDGEVLSDGLHLDEQSDFETSKSSGAANSKAPREVSKSSRVKAESAKHEPQLWLDVASAFKAASAEFEELEKCVYQSKDMGESGQEELMSCDCKPELGIIYSEDCTMLTEDGIVNTACGPDSNCINRITSIECVDDECNCGEACQNQRFQRRQYASVDVFDAGPKGYGLRAMQSLVQGTFVYEYVGEVIGERKFRQRQRDYKDQEEKHFYFMMLQKGEYIDATKKGGFGRFMNHSCLPNCYVDKWVVGNKMRMGIFCKRDIITGEELTFDYNVDRYGGEATPCYCGEPCCLGYIGGKTQTEAANKLPQNVAEALGIDEDETEDAPRRVRRKKGEDDEEYVNTLTPRAIIEADVPKIMATLVLPTERWLLKKLLERIFGAQDDRIHSSIIRLHGYQTLGSKLEKYHDDPDIAMLILQILHTWPRVTRNKISSSKIEQHVKEIAESDGTLSEVRDLAADLLQLWGELRMAYRIPRRLKSSSTQHASLDVRPNSPQSSSASERSPGPSTRLLPARPRNLQHRRPAHPRSFDNEDQRKPQVERPSTSRAPVQDELQSIIEAARKLQEEQADIARAEAERKDAEAALEAKQRAERAKKHQLRKAKKGIKASQRPRPGSTVLETTEGTPQSRTDIRTSDGANTQSVPDPELTKQLEKLFAKVVPNYVSKYQTLLGKDEVKKRAREIVKILVAKELTRPKPNVDVLSAEKLEKVKAYAKDFMHKVISRSAKRDAVSANGDEADSNRPSGKRHQDPLELDLEEVDAKRIKNT